jgi:hypothetical protein
MFSARNIELGEVPIAPSGRLDEGESEGAERRVRTSSRPSPSAGKTAGLCPLPRNGGGEGKYPQTGNHPSGTKLDTHVVSGLR